MTFLGNLFLLVLAAAWTAARWLVLGLILLLLFATLARAQEATYGVIKPSPYWEKIPLPYPVFIQEVDRLSLPGICSDFVVEGARMDACALIKDKMCFIFIRNDGIHEDFYALLIRHELAHCRGWPADHDNSTGDLAAK